MMSHDGTAVHRDQCVERVDGLGVHVVGPGGKDAQRAQFAPMLVRHDVVRIIGPRARIQERADGLPGDGLARNHAIGTIRILRRHSQQFVHVRVCQMALAAVCGRDGGPVVDHEVLARELRDVVLRDVVAERVKQFRDRHFRAAGHLMPLRRIELDEPALTCRVENRKARRDPVAFA